MKKILPLFFLCLGALSMYGQKIVFVEEFTQASCPPCEASTPMLNATLEENHEKVVQLRYQTSWPGVDPMNADNPTQVAERVAYYNVGGVPDLYMNGAAPTGVEFPTLIDNANIDSEYNKVPEITVAISHELSDDYSQAIISVDVMNVGDNEYSLDADRIRVVGVEEVISWTSPPGSTSILDFEYVMKAFFTGTAGMDLPAIAAGETWSNSWTVDLPTTIYNINQFNVLAFVQDDATKDVTGAGISEIVETDLADAGVIISAPAGTPDIVCEESTVSPTIVVTNNGSAPITSAEIQVTMGDYSTTQTWEGNLEGGASDAIQLDPITVANGTNQLVASLTTVNGAGSDASAADNTSIAGYYTGYSPTAVGTSLEQDFEEINGLIGGGIGVVWPQLPTDFGFGTFTIQEGVSAYGAGNKSIEINYYQWDPSLPANAADATMTFQKIDLSGATNASLLYDRAGGLYFNSTDRLQILVSTDCGATWDIVHDIQGTDLSTVDTHTEALFVPTANQWETDQIDLSAYDGMNDVMIQFKAISAWGNNTYLDNIRMEGTIVSAKDLEDVATIAVSPNPASQYVNLTLGLEESSDVRIAVRDLSGRVIEVVNLGTVADNIIYTHDVSEYEGGMYLFQISANNRITTKKVSVLK